MRRLLPVISFITPSTLTVSMKGISNSSMQYVPRVDFTSLNFAFITADEVLTPVYLYIGPQLGVQKAVTLTLTDGEIQPISPPKANSSWELNFHAPAINCQAVDASLQEEITDNIFDAINAFPALVPCGISYGYISWIPDSSTPNGSLPFTNSSGSYSLRSGTVGPEGEQFAASDGRPYPTSYPPLSIMIATVPIMYTKLDLQSCSSLEKSALNDSTILECSLYNATYISNFTYVNGVQNINTTLPLQFLNTVGYIGGVTGSYPFSDSWENNGTTIDLQDSPSYNTTLVEIFAYQAVMDAFGRMLVGTVAYKDKDQGAWSLDATNTSIMTTVFLQTHELAFLQSADQVNDLSRMDELFWPGDSITISDNGTMPLKDALEEAFRNVTLSLIAQYTLQPNMSSPFAPGKVNVTVTTFSNVYSYSKNVLWTTYGLAISFTLLCVSNGILAFISSGGRTYETKFSTILRTTRDVPLVDRSKQHHRDEGAEEEGQLVQIDDKDRDGKSPLPSYLGRAEIMIAQNEYSRIHGSAEEMELREAHR
ncbi:hypothetical protein EIK77_002137 [Talaromyces pinophilus]|nr:hypothetical protein EIK77_002137 [Talaromyces pinophilus]